MRRFVSRLLFWSGVVTIPVLTMSLLAISYQISGEEPIGATFFDAGSDNLGLDRRQLVRPDPRTNAIVNDEVRPIGRATTATDLAQADMLAADTADAAEAEKLVRLREKLRAVIDAKAALLNSAALEAEIAQHERQIVELKALAELQDAQRMLQEVADKYPNSDAGRQAKELLNVIRQQGEKSIPIRSRSRYRDAFEAPGSEPAFAPEADDAQEFGPAPGT